MSRITTNNATEFRADALRLPFPLPVVQGKKLKKKCCKKYKKHKRCKRCPNG